MLQINWLKLLRISSLTSFDLLKKPVSQAIGTNILGSCVYWLINLKGNSLPLMLEFEIVGLLDVIAHKNIYHHCKKHKFNIPHKAYDLVSSLLSPQSSLKSQTLLVKIHLPLRHWNSQKGGRSKMKLSDIYKYYPLNFQYLLGEKFARLLKFFPYQKYYVPGTLWSHIFLVA